MGHTDRLTGLHPPITTNGQSREIEIRADAEAAAQRRREAQLTTPVPVSWSSYLDEKDRHFRGVETAENAGDVAEHCFNRVLRLDAIKRREAEAGEATPQAKAILEGIEQVLGHGYGMLVMSMLSNPNLR
jgi:hypothetical protein